MPPVLLLIEDDPLHRKVAIEALGDIDLDIKSIDNGLEAKEFCAKKMPDVIILDWMMPEYDGLEFVQDLRAMKGGDKPYVIMCTAKSRRGNMSKALAAGADTFITKPFDPELLEIKLLEGNVIQHKDF